MLRVFFLQTLDKSRVPTEKTAHARPCGNLERAAPRRGSSYCWPWAPSGVGDAPRRRGPTAGAPRLAAPARLPRAQTAPLRERPTKKKGRTRRPAPRSDAHAPHAPARLPRAHRRAHSARSDALPGAHRRAPSARSDALLRRAPTAHLRRARRVLPARRRAHPAHSVRTHATRDTRHHSHILCVTDTLFPDMPCMKSVYRDKMASVHWVSSLVSSQEERTLLVPRKTRG